MPKRKCLFLIQDGMADRPLDVLDGKTPLEAAETPNMNQLASNGICGLADIVAPEVKVETDTGHLVLFGQDIENGPYRRGPFEAAGLGAVLNPGEVAVRINFATMNENRILLDRRAGRIRKGTVELAQDLSRITSNNGVRIEFLPGLEHRAVLILRGNDLSWDVTDSDPGFSGVGETLQEVRPLSPDPAAKKSAELLNWINIEAQTILKNHPVNMERREQGRPQANTLLMRGAGGARKYLHLGEREGLKVACVSADHTVLGIARLCGMKPIQNRRMTGNLDTDFESKAIAALGALENCDLVYLHVKGADIAAHDRQPELKAAFISKVDQMLGRIRSQVDRDTLLFALAADHATLSESGEHSGDPVPVCLSGPGIEADSVVHYSERTADSGALGRLLCKDFVRHVLEQLRA